MKMTLTRGVLLATMTSITIASVPALSQTVGVNSAVRNTVKVKATATAAEQQARVKERVNQGNDIATAQASTLQILLLDRSGLTVGPSARLKVDRFVYDPNKKASAVGMSIAKGAFRFVSGKSIRGAPGQTALNTPSASIGIRGTIVEGAVGEEAVAIAQLESALNLVGTAIDPNSASMIVLRGPGKRVKGGEKPGEISVTSGGRTVVVDNAGQAVFVPGIGLAPMGPFQLSNAGYGSFDSALRTQTSFAATQQQRNQNNQNNQNSQSQGSQTGNSGAGGSAGGAGSGGGLGIGGAGIGLAAAGLAGLVAAAASGGGSSPG